MTTFAESLFGGGRVLRATLFVAAVLGFLALASGPEEWSRVSTIVYVAVEAALVLLALAMLAPQRFRWAGRALSGLVFLSYVAYVASELVDPSGPALPGRRSQAALGNALLGTLFLGVPALLYALRSPGRSRERTIAFRSSAFPLETEPTEDDGPPPGRAFLGWLAGELARSGWSTGEPVAEDDGWSLSVERDGLSTVLGAVGHLEEDGLVAWRVFLWRRRRIDWDDDPLATRLLELLVEPAAGELEAA